MSRSARLHADGLTRCPWPGEDPFYMAYHDAEWGVPEYDDRALYEKLILDGFQAGLSWITILRKRENFRRAFDDFDPEKIARYNAKKIHALMNDAGIVRNRSKIEGAINSAKSYLKIMEDGPGFSKYLWDFVDGKPRSTTSRPPPACPPRRHCRSRFQRSLRRAVSNSWARLSSTLSCKPPGWSTITSSPASAMTSARRSTGRRASKSNDAKTVSSAQLQPRVAADALGATARPPGSLSAGYRDRRYRPWPGASRAVEWTDERRAHFLGCATHAVGGSGDARASAARRCQRAARGVAARRPGICHR